MAPYEINLPSLEIPLPRERSNWVLPRINPVGPSTAHPSLIIHPRTLKKKKSDLVRLIFDQCCHSANLNSSDTPYYAVLPLRSGPPGMVGQRP